MLAASFGVDHILVTGHFIEVSSQCFMTVSGKIQALIPVVGNGLDRGKARTEMVAEEPTTNKPQSAAP